ncbi:acyltransferase [Actinoalloteichus sp. AHMU CJ021]|uniref:acyltransferase n=1 Tax=Actinoalloteichus sp. AHMU CJ021 TaxID=2072503 RepID=UPI0026ABCCCC
MSALWESLVSIRSWFRRDPEQARFLTRESLRWVIRNRAFTPWYLVRYLRLLRLRVSRPQVVLRGMVFLDRGVSIECRAGHGRLELGRWVHVGAGTAVRCHEGSLRIGDKAVLAQRVTVNCYLDVEIGAASLVADGVYVCDFDHVTTDPHRPIKDQGIVKTPVRVGEDCWLGTKATVLRGSRIGRGSVVGANAVVRGELPPYAVAAGIPARVVRRRVPDGPAGGGDEGTGGSAGGGAEGTGGSAAGGAGAEGVAGTPVAG